MKRLTHTTGVKCSNCGDVIVSKHVHDFHYCRCGVTFVDGGLDYLRYGWDEKIAPEPETVKIPIKWIIRKKIYQFLDRKKK